MVTTPVRSLAEDSSNSDDSSPRLSSKDYVVSPPYFHTVLHNSKGPPHPPPPQKISAKSKSAFGGAQSLLIKSVYRGNVVKLAAGAGIGILVVMITLIILCVSCKKRKRKRKAMAMQYYGAPPALGTKASERYYGDPPTSDWHNGPSSSEHHVRLTQQPGPAGSPGGIWLSTPTPMPMSSQMSLNFSGACQPVLPPPPPNYALGFNKSTFTYEELAAATNGFSESNLLGQGGFGYVHKGVLPSGKEVAVKSLKSGSGQGEREFQAEVDIISRVHHRHLVSLDGYCIAGGQRMLVYEFVPNNTLEHHLHGKGLPVMDWPTRLRIAIGSAKGLAYLHEDCHPRIIHRDIKAANILLDDNFEAMVADFGLAKLSSDTNTHVSTRVMGTFGYLAPEYASSGKLTEKSDVFSFGVMLLELITGKRPVESGTSTMEDSLVDWARPLVNRAVEDGHFEELLDKKLENQDNSREMLRMIACAGASIRHSAKRRSKMSQIVRVLEGDVSLEDLNEGIRTSPSNLSSGSSVVKGLTSSSDFGSETGNSSDSHELGLPKKEKPLF